MDNDRATNQEKAVDLLLEETEVIDVRHQTISIQAVIAKQEKIRGFTVNDLDRKAFIDRIHWKDWSAYFIGEAFCSMYRTGISADLDLTMVCSLDAQGKNFLFKTIFARDAHRWSDTFLYDLEQEIKEILDLEYVDGKIVRLEA